MTVLCGSGCQGAHDLLLTLGERLKAPMVHALRGKEHVEWENPYDVGMTGLIGFSSGYYAMLECDVLLMLGTDFPYRQFYPEGGAVRIAQVDLKAEQIGRRRSIPGSWVTSGRRSRHSCRALRRSVIVRISIKRGNTIASRARASMIWRPRHPAGSRFTRSKLPKQ